MVMGPKRHTIAGRMMDQMHGEGAHDGMHQLMDRMMRMWSRMGNIMRGMMGHFSRGTYR